MTMVVRGMMIRSYEEEEEEKKEEEEEEMFTPAYH
jgi:hypothetical protein